MNPGCDAFVAYCPGAAVDIELAPVACGGKHKVATCVCLVRDGLCMCAGDECALLAPSGGRELWRVRIASSACCVASGGDWVIVGTEGGMVAVLRAQDGSALGTASHSERRTCPAPEAVLAVDCCDDKAASTGADGRLVVWPIANSLGEGREVLRSKSSTDDPQKAVLNAFWSDDMRRLLAAVDSEMKLEPLRACAFSADGARLAAGGEGQFVLVFEEEMDTQTLGGHEAHVVAVAWIHDRVVSLDLTGCLRLFSATTTQIVASSLPSNSLAVALSVSRDLWLAVVSTDGVRVYDTEAAQVTTTVCGMHRVGIRTGAALWVGDVVSVYTVGHDKRLARWTGQASAGEAVGLFAGDPYVLRGSVKACAFSDDSVALIDATGLECWVRQTSAPSGLLGSAPADASPFAVIALRGFVLATGDKLGCIAVFEVDAPAAALARSWRYHRETIVSLSFIDDDLVFSSDIAGDICVVAWRTGQISRRIAVRDAIDTPWQYLKFSTETWCLVGGRGSTLVAWDPHRLRLEKLVTLAAPLRFLALELTNESTQPRVALATSQELAAWTPSFGCRWLDRDTHDVAGLSAQRAAGFHNIIAWYNGGLIAVFRAEPNASYLRIALLAVEGLPPIAAACVRHGRLTVLTKRGWLTSRLLPGDRSATCR